MREEVIPISLDAVVGEAGKMKAEGYRLVTLSAAELDAEKVDILYHYDKNLTMKHLRLTVAKDVQVPSSSWRTRFRTSSACGSRVWRLILTGPSTWTRRSRRRPSADIP
jgi:hypothetical protein